MTPAQKIFKFLKIHLPENSVQYCWDLWNEDPFNFLITKSRSTKLGDFRYRKDRTIQTITINSDLNAFQFLITYLHEVAHHRVFKNYGTGKKPHGLEWKRTFQETISPMLSDLVFPIDILIPLKRHMQNPKACTGADLFLIREIKKYNIQKQEPGHSLLTDVKLGSFFELKGRKFQKETVRRTKVLCIEIPSGKKYLISTHAEVRKLED